MIIEQIKVDGPKNIFLVHIDLKEDSPRNVEAVTNWLKTVPDYAVLVVPNGSPCPTNPLPKITLFNAENPVLAAIVEKLSIYTEPGSIIPLTAEEMKAWVNSNQTDWTQI